MRLKKGVKIQGIRPEMLLGKDIAEGAYYDNQCRFRITSALDGDHSYNSLHYSGNALDYGIQTWDGDGYITEEKAQKIRDDIKERCGNDFDVILEYNKKHIHHEYQPRK